MHLIRTLFEAPPMLREDCSGVTMLEYAIMGSIIAAALVLAVPPITNAVTADFQYMAGKIPTTTGS